MESEKRQEMEREVWERGVRVIERERRRLRVQVDGL